MLACREISKGTLYYMFLFSLFYIYLFIYLCFLFLFHFASIWSLRSLDTISLMIWHEITAIVSSLSWLHCKSMWHIWMGQTVRLIPEKRYLSMERFQWGVRILKIPKWDFLPLEKHLWESVSNRSDFLQL